MPEGFFLKYEIFLILTLFAFLTVAYTHHVFNVGMFVPQVYRIMIALFSLSTRDTLFRLEVGFRFKGVDLYCHNGPFPIFRFLSAVRYFPSSEHTHSPLTFPAFNRVFSASAKVGMSLV